MNKTEATRFLALVKLAYPSAYRDMDDISKKATINMWASSFPDVPYQIMEQGFNHFRFVSKFPPTVAEMADELKSIHFQATECALIQKTLGNEDGVKQYKSIMDYTSRYKDDSYLGGLNINALQGLLSSGEGYAGLPEADT